DVTDPVELLMKVQLGGGTNIAQALQWAGQHITRVDRSIVVVISDFYEGGPVGHLLHQVKQLVSGGTIVLGLAALNRQAQPVYDRDLAKRMVDHGAEVAAMTPGELAVWLAEKVQR